jgi:hypothetical protein
MKTPSLATIIPKQLTPFWQNFLSPLSVRYFSARSGSVPGYDDGEGLKLSPLLSAAWLKIATSIAPAAAK